jgi:hypothetical protein
MSLQDLVSGLQGVAELIQTATVKHLRVSDGAYAELGDLNCQIVPPGYKFGVDRGALPSYLRGMPLSTFKFPVASDIKAKDRFTLGDRLFEAIFPVTAKTIEIRRKVLVREIQLPERILYLALEPDGYHGASTSKPLPELIKVIPYANVTDKPVEMVKENDNQSFVAANLKQLMAAEIGRSFVTDEVLARLLYCLIVPSDVEVTAEQARDRVFPRYKLNGSPVLMNFQWATDYAYSLTLVEDK